MMPKVGIIGLGFMGVTHFNCWQKVRGSKIVAVCDTDKKRLSGDWSTIAGNLGLKSGRQDLSGIRRYSSAEDIIADEEVELIDVCLPTYLHPQVAIAALKGGKHVIVEKPIALDVRSANRMIAAAEKAGRHLMVAQVLRFIPEFRLIQELIESGEYGKVKGLHLKRIGAKPEWGYQNWFQDPKRSGGGILDLHIHDTDFVRHLFGMPQQVRSSGVITPQGEIEYVVTQYVYPDSNLCVTAQGGTVAAKGLPFEHGYDLFMEHATVEYNLTWGGPPTIYLQDGKKRKLRVKAVDGFQAELQYASDCLRKGEEPEMLSAESARDSLLLVQKEMQSVRSGRPVRVG